MYRVLLILFGCLLLMHQSVAADEVKNNFQNCIEQNNTFGFCLNKHLPPSDEDNPALKNPNAVLKELSEMESRWWWVGNIWGKTSAERLLTYRPTVLLSSDGEL